MKRVREMTGAASGCWASAPMARDTAQPSPMAVIGAPIPTVAPAMMIEIMPMSSRLSMECFLLVVRALARLPFLDARGGCDEDEGEDRENVGLYHADQQSQHVHDDREEERRDRERGGGDQRAAHHVAEQADRQGDG